MNWARRLINRIRHPRGTRRNSNDEVFRAIEVNSVEQTEWFCSNKIKNSKYTILTFLPKNFAEQFSRFMNQYFLLIACLQLFPTITPVSPITTWVPLSVIFAISAFKEALDDYKRHKNDRQANRRRFKIIRGGVELEVQSQEIRVGDVVYVDEDQEFPADMVLLNSSEDNSSCFVQTSNIDGETDLKVRTAVAETANATADQLQAFKGTIECPEPNSRIYSFDANIKIDGKTHSLDVNQLLLQGTFLRNTDYIYGAVVYTGNETKIGMNKHKAKKKWTKIDLKIDDITRWIFAFQLTIVLAFGIAGNVLSSQQFSRASYVVGSELGAWYTYLIIPARMLLLLSFSIPISLKVSLDIIKYVAAMFIDWDVQMYDEKTDEPANAANTAIAEDLGQIEYIFTDKTGTLTDNVMVYRACSINTISYGSSNVRGDFSNPLLEEKVQMVGSPENEFFRALALCHSVNRVVDHHTKILKYRGASPDEETLVETAAKMGVDFRGREESILTLDNAGQTQKFQILETLDFTSERRRMSILVRELDGERRIILYTKGSDDVLLPATRKDTEELSSQVRNTTRHIDDYAQQGFRILCVTSRVIGEQEYEEWAKSYKEANTALVERESKIVECYRKLESNLILLGSTAIEDRLQDNVPETIRILREAGIKFWMVTGDKRATATQIGLSCNLLSTEAGSYIVHVDQKTNSADAMRKLLLRELSVVRNLVSDSQEHYAYMICDGQSLHTIFEHSDLSDLFIDIGIMCHSVICCRVSPHQKSEIVLSMKKRKFMTLSIGDGGNDVNMIQSAHIGVGIKGREGLQAARAADYSIAQFAFLKRLLLVHGRYSYKRTAFVALYCFYKSIFICLIQALYQIYAGFTGTSLLNTFALSTYNILFTALPILFYTLDKDISESAIMLIPSAYQETVAGLAFNGWVFLSWVMRALYQSSITLIMALELYSGSWVTRKGSDPGETLTALVAYTVAILIQTLTVFLQSNSLTIINQVVIWGTCIFYFLALLALSQFSWSGMLGSALELYAEPTYWLSVIVITILAMLPFIVVGYIVFNYRPDFYQIIQYYKYKGLFPTSTFELRSSREASHEMLTQIRDKNRIKSPEAPHSQSPVRAESAESTHSRRSSTSPLIKNLPGAIP